VDRASFPRSVVIVASALAVAVGGLAAFTASPSAPSRPREPEKERALEALAELPLSFEANRGQTDPRVRFLSRAGGYTAFLTDRGAVFSLPGAAPDPGHEGPQAMAAALSLELVGSRSEPEIVGREALPGTVSYFTGPDPGGWQTSIPTYGAIRYRDVYPGIDLLFRGSAQAIEYDFVVAPGADPDDVALRFRGAERIRIDQSGDLVLQTAAGSLLHRAPTIYQTVGGERQLVPGGYRLDGTRVNFELGAYDSDLPLVIDPLVYSTFLGGTNAENDAVIAVDGTGRAYVAGMTASADFPTTPGAYDTTFNSPPFDVRDDVYVSRLSPDGRTLEYSTFLGGRSWDGAYAIALDDIGRVYITGETHDSVPGPDYPTTPGAYNTTHNGDVDVFVTRLSPNGASLEYSTFVGGSGIEVGYGIGVDDSDRAHLTGFTEDADTDYPTTEDAFDRVPDELDDAIYTRLTADGSGLGYSTILGGNNNDEGTGITVDGAGRAHLTGYTHEGDEGRNFPVTPGALDTTQNGASDVFYTRFSGGDLEYSTFLGGASGDEGWGIALDPSGRVYLTGSTRNDTSEANVDYPTTPGAYDGSHNGEIDIFVTRLSADGLSRDYSTYLGGSDFDRGLPDIVVNGSGVAFVAGRTESSDYPTTGQAFDRTYNGSGEFGGGGDVFVSRLSANGSILQYSTFLGGSENDEAFGIARLGSAVVVAGRTGSSNFPSTAGAFDETFNGGAVDAFVAKVATTIPSPDHDVGVAGGGFSTKSRIDLSRNGEGPYEVKIKLKNFGKVTEDIIYSVTAQPAEVTFTGACSGTASGVGPGATVTVVGCSATYGSADDPDPVLTLTVEHDDSDGFDEVNFGNNTESVTTVIKP
jgi:hypothetical protein